ncbi:unnamed protein product, partial [marine sediment metagenome]
EGLTTEPTSEIKIVGSGDDEYRLKCDVSDGDVSMPLAFANSSGLFLGDDDDRIVLDQSRIIDDQYFILTTGYEQGEKSYILQYQGADVPSGGGTSTLKFKNLASGETIERSFDTDATLRLGGSEWMITEAAGENTSEDDFDINISDNYESLIITTEDAAINITDATPSLINLSIFPIDRSDMIDDVEELSGADDIVVEITKTISDEVDLDVEDGLNWGFESLEDEDNIERAITPYGAELKYVDEDDDPNRIDIVWPDSQREAQA